MVALNSLEKVAVAAPGTGELSYDLSESFSAKSSTQIWLFSYSRATLIRAFPKLSDYTNEQLSNLLRPSFSSSSGFNAPAADAVSRIEEINEDVKDLSYSSGTWNQWLQYAQQNKIEPLKFQLSKAVGCPYGPAEFALFDITNPKSTCTIRRTDNCALSFSNCDVSQRGQLCLGVATSPEFFQNPNGDLQLGELQCSTTQVESSVRGVSQAWRCAPGTCADTEVTLASQEAQNLSDVSLLNREWKANLVLEHQATFPKGNAVYDGKRDLILSAYEDEKDKIRFKSYQWILSQTEVDTVEQREISIVDGDSIASAEYDRLVSLWMHKDRYFAVLNGAQASYLLKNLAGDPGDARQMSFAQPIKLSHDISSQGISLTDSPEFYPSDLVPGQVYAVSHEGLVVFDEGGQVIAQTASNTGLQFDSGKYRIFLGGQGTQESVFVCSLVQPKFEKCGVGLYVFDSSGQFLGEKRLKGGLRTTTFESNALFIDAEFTVGSISLSQAQTNSNYETIYVPALGSQTAAVDRALNISRKSFGYNPSTNQGTSVVAILYGKYAGILDLDSGFSTAISAWLGTPETPVPMNLLGLMTNNLETGHFLLVQDKDKTMGPQWVFVPSLR